MCGGVFGGLVLVHNNIVLLCCTNLMILRSRSDTNRSRILPQTESTTKPIFSDVAMSYCTCFKNVKAFTICLEEILFVSKFVGP